MTLRERLMALAGPCTCIGAYVRIGRRDPTCTAHDMQDAVLDAARLALEDAAQACERRAKDTADDNCYRESDTNAVVWRNDCTMLMCEEADDCAAAIRALRDGIA